MSATCRRLYCGRIELSRRLTHFTIIGPGKVGAALAFTLHDAGKQIAAIIGRTPSEAKKLGRRVSAGITSDDVRDIPDSTNVLVITVPGERVAKIADAIGCLSQLRWDSMFAFHTSGAHPAALLKPLSRRGVEIAAIHPIQTFPRLVNRPIASHLLRGIYYGVDCSTDALPFARSIVRSLNGKLIRVPPAQLALYHASCVFASGYAVQLLDIIRRCASQIDLKEPWERIYSPLLFRSIGNAMRSSPVEAMTGPIMRGDAATIELHIDALGRSVPQALDVYRALARISIETAYASGRIDTAAKKSLENALRSYPAGKK